MHRIHRVARSVAGLGLAALIAGACFEDDLNEVLGPRPTGANSIFQSYVALGNSITAGYQSSGITDATQRQSYAFLLAQQMGTRYAYASMFGRGCNPPVTNFQTQAAGTIANAQRVLICDLRNGTTATDILNNVAVPNASSYDPTDPDGTPFSNTLTTLILGGKTQVQRALEAKPTFASIWIGNNDVLGFAVQDGRANAPTGLLGMTPTATFQTNYDAMIDQLTAGAPNLRGVLIGVVQVANAPIMFPASAMSNAAFKASFDAIAGVTTTLDASCTSTGAGFLSLLNTFLAHQIRAGAHPPIVACVAGGASGLIPAPVGDILVLDPAEQTTIAARIDSYNAHIVATAASLGWAYVDPNSLLSTLKTMGTLVRATPAYCGTAPCNPPAAPFGTGMSLDGVHPTLAVHREIANAIIAAVNTTYSTTLAPVP